MSQRGKYYEYPNSRRAIVDLLEEGARSHYTPVFVEVDVTEALKRIKYLKQKKKIKISFLSWFLKCIADAIEKNKSVQAYRHKRGLMVFDEVDISLIVERDNPEEDGYYKKIMMPYILRDVNSKSNEDIFSEINAAQTEEISPGDTNLGDQKNTAVSRLFVKAPRIIRQLIFWRRIRKNAFVAKATMGTVLVSPVYMIFNRKDYAWGISRSLQPVSILMTALVRRPEFINGTFENRDKLCLTIGFKHDLIDGGPIARFIESLRKTAESAYGLNESED